MVHLFFYFFIAFQCHHLLMNVSNCCWIIQTSKVTACFDLLFTAMAFTFSSLFLLISCPVSIIKLSISKATTLHSTHSCCHCTSRTESATARGIFSFPHTHLILKRAQQLIVGYKSIIWGWVPFKCAYHCYRSNLPTSIFLSFFAANYNTLAAKYRRQKNQAVFCSAFFVLELDMFRL